MKSGYGKAWSDSGGTARSNTWTFTVANWVTLNSGLSLPLSAADTTKPGFTVQVAQLDPALIGRPDDGIDNQIDNGNALVGGLYFPWYGTNTVNTYTWPLPLYDNVWAWEGAMDFAINGSAGDFTWDQALPGIPGVTSKDSNIAAWFKGYVAFTNVGFYRMQISSDDGFRLSQGLGINERSSSFFSKLVDLRLCSCRREGVRRCGGCSSSVSVQRPRRVLLC